MYSTPSKTMSMVCFWRCFTISSYCSARHLVCNGVTLILTRIGYKSSEVSTMAVQRSMTVI